MRRDSLEQVRRSQMTSKHLRMRPRSTGFLLAEGNAPARAAAAAHLEGEEVSAAAGVAEQWVDALAAHQLVGKVRELVLVVGRLLRGLQKNRINSSL